MAYLIFFFWALVGLVRAQSTRICLMGTPQISLPSCMEPCFLTGGCNGEGCPCASNLKGWCESAGGEGPDSWFARWGQCVVGSCPDDGDITNLMLLYVAQCEGTVGGPLNNDTVAYPLRDWAPKASQYLSQSTSASRTASSSASQSAQTLTGIIPTATGNLASANISDGSNLQTASLASAHTSTASPASEAQGDSPALGVAAIVGIAVGGAVLLALVIGLVALILRRRRRKALATPELPPNYATADVKDGYDKPELDSQVVAYQHVKADTGTPVLSPIVYAELDGGRPRSPVLEMSGRS